MKCFKCRKTIPANSNFCNWCGEPQPKDVTAKKRRLRSRPNGSGTAYYNNRLSSWVAEKTFGYKIIEGDDGKPRRLAVRANKTGFKTKAEALSFIDKLQDPRSIKPAPSEITLKELFDLWFPTWKAGYDTMKNYEYAFKVFRPVWHIPMSEQDIDDLQECLDEYETKNNTNGKRTRQVAKTCLGLVYKYGIPRNLVPPNLAMQPNLAQFLIVRSGSSVHKEGLSDIELAKIKKAIGSVPYAEYIFCACYLSFRPSAFLALKVSDYNPKERAFVGGIKTEAGINRTVTVSPKIQPFIDQLIAGKNPEDAVFHNPKTGRKFPLKDYRDIFYAVLDKLGIDNPINENMQHRLTPHSCRHTFATLMKNIDAPAKDKLALIGHTDEKMLRYYQDVNFNDLRNITDKL